MPEPATPPPPIPALTPSEDGLVLRSEGLPATATATEGGAGEGVVGARSAMLVAAGIAVAALRGMAGWLADRRQRFEDQAPVRLAAAKAAAEQITARAEHAAALHKISSDADQARAKARSARVQSPTEFGASARKNAGKGAGAGSGPGGGAGKKNPAAGPGTGSAAGPGGGGKSPGRKDNSGPKGSGDGAGSGNGKGPKGTDSKDKASAGALSPKGAGSPALERARGRQERAAARQDARAQRRAGRETARQDARAKDGDAARERRNRARDAEENRRETIRQARFEAKQKAKAAQEETRRKKKEEAAAARAARTTLAQATEEQARTRLDKRRKNLDPPVISRPGKPDKEKKEKKEGQETGPAAPPGTALELVAKPDPGGAGEPAEDTTPKPKSKPWWRRKPKTTSARSPRVPRPPKGRPSAGAAPGAAGSRPGSRSRRNREQTPPPRQTPGEDGSWLRPPPGMAATYSTTITREPARPKNPPRRSAAFTRGRGQLPPSRPPTPATPSPTPSGPPSAPPAGPGGSSGSGGRSAPGPVPDPRKEVPPMGGTVQHTTPVESVQFADADLTVYDVIESDEDQAQEILAGADHARLVADRCDHLAGAIEALKAELEARFVPGVLVGWCARLIERAQAVEEKASAVAQGLPHASEAIAHAGHLAADHDKPVADLVRDLGHTAPADASYHKE